MSRRVVVEEPCEVCGEVWTEDRKKPHLKPREGSNYVWTDCEGSGGSRTVLEGIPDEWVQRASKVLDSLLRRMRDLDESVADEEWTSSILEAAVFGGSDVEG